MSGSPGPSNDVQLALDSDFTLSDDDLRDLFPWSVRPAVIGTLWVLVVVLLIVFGALALAYSRMAG